MHLNEYHLKTFQSLQMKTTSVKSTRKPHVKSLIYG